MYKAPEEFNGQDVDASPFDSPEAKASTAFVEAQSVAMTKQIEADKHRKRPSSTTPRVIVSSEPGAYSYETPRHGR